MREGGGYRRAAMGGVSFRSEGLLAYGDPLAHARGRGHRPRSTVREGGGYRRASDGVALCLPE